MKKSTNTSTSAKNGLVAFSKLLPYLAKYKFLLVVAMLGLVIGVVVSFSIGVAIRLVIDGFPTDVVDGEEFLSRVLSITVVVIVAYAIVQYLSNYLLRKVAVKVINDMRCHTFDILINQEMKYIDQQTSGEVQTRVVADTQVVGNFLATQIPVVLVAALSLIAGMVGAVYISLKMTLMVLVALPVIFLPFIVLGKRLRDLGSRTQAAVSEVGKFAGESLRNIKVMHAYNRKKDASERFSAHADKVVKYTVSIARLQIGINSCITALVYIGFAVLLYSASKDIYAGTQTLGQLTSFAYFTMLIIRSAAMFFNATSSLHVAVGSADKMMEYLSMSRHDWPSLLGDFKSEGAIQFRGVSFCYPSRAQEEVLNGVSFDIKPGTKVALVGRSGAGKSTVFELLLRFYEAGTGAILVDGIDYRDLDVDKVRSFIGYVPQKESLISGTVYDNISYGIHNADESMVIAAAKMASADEFIMDLPRGYHTDLGEAGSRLSGGQKQRISLARALIRDPQILLLDEAKSGLDTESERLVADAINKWAAARKATVITITHSLNTVINSELIIVLENGVVAGQGSHSTLLKSCPTYRQLSFAESSESPVRDLLAV